MYREIPPKVVGFEYTPTVQGTRSLEVDDFTDEFKVVGIPGFPPTSILIGVALVIIILMARRTASFDRTLSFAISESEWASGDFSFIVFFQALDHHAPRLHMPVPGLRPLLAVSPPAVNHGYPCLRTPLV